MQCISENKDAGLLVALVGAPDPYLEKHRLQRLGNSNLALEHILNSNKDYMTWCSKEKAAAPSDWQQLADAAGESIMSAYLRECGKNTLLVVTWLTQSLTNGLCVPKLAGLQVLSAVPIKVSDKHIGLLTIGFDANGGQQGQHSM